MDAMVAGDWGVGQILHWLVLLALLYYARAFDAPSSGPTNTDKPTHL